MIIFFDFESSYTSSRNPVVVLENMREAYQNMLIIDNELTKGLVSTCVVNDKRPVCLFICSPLDLTFKSNKIYKKIHHTLQLQSKSINDYFSNGNEKLKYICIQKVLKLINQDSQNSIIIKN